LETKTTLIAYLSNILGTEKFDLSDISFRHSSSHCSRYNNCL